MERRHLILALLIKLPIQFTERGVNMKVNFNSLAVDMCEQDIGPEQLDIAQMKHLLRQLADNIAVRPEIKRYWNDYVNKRGKILMRKKKK